ncbi:hypothetical protein [Demequina lutea]|uniref:Uncharacterized protein n=1 Tax=Demequina lutea TaxID=431489 RepID=A0A7Z0CH18_9MICO|nr:hypothetical protein [Demequina lutea]NYI40349.1 hypothetical protein [Demequina lutea]
MDEADKDGVALVGRMAVSGLAATVAMLHPEAAVLAMTALPALDTGLLALRERRRNSCGYVLAVASNEANTPIDELVEALVNNPAKALLLARTLEAAADSASEAKVRVLGRGLASGAVTEDDALVMEEVGWAVMLREIEAPHLRILDYLAKQDPETPGHMMVASWQDLKAVSGFDELLGPALSMLERNSLVQTVQSLGLDDHMRNRWGITPASAARHFVRGYLSKACLSRFSRAAEAAAPAVPSAEGPG